MTEGIKKCLKTNNSWSNIMCGKNIRQGVSCMKCSNIKIATAQQKKCNCLNSKNLPYIAFEKLFKKSATAQKFE
jgi:hypothetical protein